MYRLQTGKGRECVLFQTIAEQGHYAGRTEPTDTRQGIYAAAPGGALLASVNTRSADRVAAMLESALARWAAMPEAERYLDLRADELEAPLADRWERLYPTDGLVLRVSSRDLPLAEGEGGEPAPREGRRRRGRRGWKRHAWNHDYAWFRRDEIMRLVPARAEVGARASLPPRLVERLVRLHLVDNVRGQTAPFRLGHVHRAELSAEITAVDGPRLALRIEGRTRAVAAGKAIPEEPPRHLGPEYAERGVELELLGTAVVDRRSRRFTAFDVVAVGTRWGGTRYNGRERDPGPHPIGFALELAGDDRPVAPAFVWEYGW